MLQRNDIVRICRYNCVFSGTIVEELPAGLPRFIKHYQDVADKCYCCNLLIWRKELLHLTSQSIVIQRHRRGA